MSSACKRQRVTTAAAAAEGSDAAAAHNANAGADMPPLGEDASVWIADKQCVLRHGTSLRLMAECSAFLNESQEFNEVDPEGDWETWSARAPGAFILYYAAIVDPLHPGHQGMHCVLRAVLDGWDSPVAPHNSRLVIDYVACKASERGRGHASMLVEHVRRACVTHSANLYVLALEDSCPYWVDRGFVLEQQANITARLNVFPDVHLLRQQGDPSDVGSVDDLAFAQDEDEVLEAESEDDDNEAEATSTGGNGGNGGNGGAAAPGRGAGSLLQDDDLELQAALALSLVPTAASSPDGNAQSADPHVGKQAIRKATGHSRGEIVVDDEERAMSEALALSLS